MRNWLKKVIRECLEEKQVGTPFIQSYRPPREKDLYNPGTTWKHGKDFYTAKKSSTIWEKIE